MNLLRVNPNAPRWRQVYLGYILWSDAALAAIALNAIVGLLFVAAGQRTAYGVLCAAALVWCCFVPHLRRRAERHRDVMNQEQLIEAAPRQSVSVGRSFVNSLLRAVTRCEDICDEPSKQVRTAAWRVYDNARTRLASASVDDSIDESEADLLSREHAAVVSQFDTEVYRAFARRYGLDETARLLFEEMYERPYTIDEAARLQVAELCSAATGEDRGAFLMYDAMCRDYEREVLPNSTSLQLYPSRDVTPW